VVSSELCGELCGGGCRLAQFGRASWYRKSTAKDQTALRLRIRDLAHARPRFDYLRIWALLRREGWAVNRKRVRRWYRLDGLQLRMRVRRRKHRTLHREPASVPAGPQEQWSMDFVHDTLSEGRPYRILIFVDQWSHSSPVIAAGFRMSGELVSRVLDRVLGDRSGPLSIHGGSWDGVSISCVGGLGLSPSHSTRLYSTRETGRKRLC
jgi:putative transposase